LRGENRRVPVSAVTARRHQGGWYVVNGIWPLLAESLLEARFATAALRGRR
jgi:hypothetical protein